MINHLNESGSRRLAFAAVCLLICVPARAQSGDTSKSGSEPKPAAQSAGIAPADDESYVIGVDDVLGISVWKEPEISRVVPVRSDGKISLPLVGEVDAADRTPKQLKVALTEKLKNYISEPEVTVIVQETRSKKYNILGQVTRPGSYFLSNSVTVLDAIAQAGGFRDFAKKKSIYVLRKNPDGSDSRLPFNYKDVIAGKNTAQNVKLQAGDTVVVP
jgi:polysaccharide biosynthesis/export protein